MEGLGETKDVTSAEGLGKCAAKGTVARLWPDALRSAARFLLCEESGSRHGGNSPSSLQSFGSKGRTRVSRAGARGGLRASWEGRLRIAQH